MALTTLPLRIRENPQTHAVQWGSKRYVVNAGIISRWPSQVKNYSPRYMEQSPSRGHKASPKSGPGDESWKRAPIPSCELEFKLTQSHMAHKSIPRGEVGARALRVRPVLKEGAWASAVVFGSQAFFVVVLPRRGCARHRMTPGVCWKQFTMPSPSYSGPLPTLKNHLDIEAPHFQIAGMFYLLEATRILLCFTCKKFKLFFR